MPQRGYTIIAWGIAPGRHKSTKICPVGANKAFVLEGLPQILWVDVDAYRQMNRPFPGIVGRRSVKCILQKGAVRSVRISVRESVGKARSSHSLAFPDIRRDVQHLTAALRRIHFTDPLTRASVFAALRRGALRTQRQPSWSERENRKS